MVIEQTSVVKIMSSQKAALRVLNPDRMMIEEGPRCHTSDQNPAFNGEPSSLTAVPFMKRLRSRPLKESCFGKGDIGCIA